MSSRALLKAALPLIAQHGLTIQAIQASAAGVDQATLNKLFPSPARATCELLNVYDQETLQSAFNKCSSQANGNDSDAWSIVSASLQSKLADSHLVREHLAQALAVLIANRSVRAKSSFIPTPQPLLERSYRIVNDALYTAGWQGNFSTDWYTARMRLSTAFCLSELHLLSPENKDVLSSLNVFRTIAGSAARPSQARTHGQLPPPKDWIEWGASGWLGIFRSFGL